MSFTIFFPKQGQEDGAYTYLDDEEDIYEVIKDEVRQSISDMGSEGYDLLSPDFPWEASSGNTYTTEEEILDATEEPLADLEEYTHLCHERGIDQAVTMWAPGIHKDLWVRYRSTEYGTQDVAVDDTTYAKLPDGTTIALKEVRDEG